MDSLGTAHSPTEGRRQTVCKSMSPTFLLLLLIICTIFSSSTVVDRTSAVPMPNRSIMLRTGNKR